jgi:hypothetical protein
MITNTKTVKTDKGAKAEKVARIASAQYKLARALNMTGEGHVANLRASDVSGNLCAAGAKVTGATTEKVVIHTGKHGLAWIAGKGNADGVFQFAGGSINSALIKRREFVGTLADAVKFVMGKGKATAGARADGAKFSHVLDNGAQYGVATDGKRLLRLEARKIAGKDNGQFNWTLGK